MGCRISTKTISCMKAIYVISGLIIRHCNLNQPADKITMACALLGGCVNLLKHCQAGNDKCARPRKFGCGAAIKGMKMAQIYV
jgi:hypothetical protein